MEIAECPPVPALSPEERRHLEDAYRQAIGTVRALARALGKPCPIVSREERRGTVPPAQPVAPP
jgi:IS30 family transposase